MEALLGSTNSVDDQWYQPDDGDFAGAHELTQPNLTYILLHAFLYE